jgi:hypothetical protein
MSRGWAIGAIAFAASCHHAAQPATHTKVDPHPAQSCPTGDYPGAIEESATAAFPDGSSEHDLESKYFGQHSCAPEQPEAVDPSALGFPRDYAIMFLTRSSWTRCHDLFDSGAFADAVQRIPAVKNDAGRAALQQSLPEIEQVLFAESPPSDLIDAKDAKDASPIQLGLAAVFAASKWQLENPSATGSTDGAGAGPPACTHADNGSISTTTTFYRRGCGPSLSTAMVIAHQLGHAIDVASGDAAKDAGGVEKRASIYAASLAECYVRDTEAFYQSFAAANDAQKQVLACFAADWHRTEAMLDKARTGGDSNVVTSGAPDFTSGEATCPPCDECQK